MQKKRRRTHLRRKRIPTSILLRSKRKLCPFKEAGIDRIDYKDVELLKDYVTQGGRSEEHTSELQSLVNLVCRLLLEKKNNH